MKATGKAIDDTKNATKINAWFHQMYVKEKGSEQLKWLLRV